VKKVLIAALAVAAVVVSVDDAFAAKRFKRSEMNEKQRKEFMEMARKACKKKFGGMATVNQVDYARQKIWCSY
jgi:hypothetical protein